MPRELVYQMFFKPTMIVVAPPPAAAIRFIRINVYYNPFILINVVVPDIL